MSPVVGGSRRAEANNGLPISTEQLFDLVPSPISIQDREFRILRVNTAYRQLMGDKVGHECFRVCKGRREVCLACPLARTFSDGEIHHSEEVVRTVDGRHIQVEVQTSPIHDAHGVIVGGMEVLTDISHTVSMQQELVLLGQAMAGMAHYMKNVLMGLEGGVFVVEEGMSSSDEELMQEGWAMVRRNIERVTRLSRDQLYCSKQRVPERKLLNPNQIVCEVARLYRERMTQDEVSLYVQLDDEVEDYLLDPEGFHNLVSNLIVNAFDACRFDTMKTDHWISVSTLREPGGQLTLEVADNGTGIPSDLHSEVFSEMFSTKGARGTGLGLLVVYRVATAHRGEISVLSDDGFGTVFTLIFPPPEDVASIEMCS